MPDPERALATVLFTDVVGSTERAAVLGDERWRELLQRHHAAVRREIRRRGGREVATAGDGFLAIFEQPEPAIRCAWAIRDAVRELGLEIRGGLHMGTVDVLPQTVGGIGVHIGARVAARAGAGEVLVSGTVRDAVAGSGFEFEDRGSHVLKGVPGEWRLFAISSVPPEPARVHRRRPRMVARVALAAVLVVALGIGGFLVRDRLRQEAALRRGDAAGAGGPAAAGQARSRDAGTSRPAGLEPKRPAVAGGPGSETGAADTAGATSEPGAAGGTLTLAVLPFHTLTAREEIGFLGVGIPDAIITKLANARRIRLRPTTAILPYEGKEVDLQQAGRELASDYLLTGTMQKAGDRLRVGVQLVRVTDGQPLWGDRYDLLRADLLGLQDSIADQVASALRIQITAAERERIYRRYTRNVAAYELYLKGRSQLVRYNKESTRAAVDAFERALELDAGYALAHAGLAMASAQMGRDAPETEVDGWRERARREAGLALGLDQELSEAHEALAAVYRNTEFDWERTIEESGRALELNSNLDLPRVYRAAAFYHLGLMDLADREARAALETNPRAVEPLRLRGTIALYSGRFTEAVPLLEDVRRASEGAVSDWYLAQAYWYTGARDTAEAMLAKLSGSGSAQRRAQATLASFLAARGQLAKARRLLADVLAGSYMDHHVAYSLGVAYGQLGDRAEANRWLARAAETGLPCYPLYEVDPLLRPLRKDAGFQRFMAQLRRSWEGWKRRYGVAEEAVAMPEGDRAAEAAVGGTAGPTGWYG